MRGAIDDLDKIKAIFKEFEIPEYYIHADAALSGMILPFLNNTPPWNFADGVDSISISGHKLIGAPVPCGVVLANKSHVDRVARLVEYVGVSDTTIAGSRSSFSPLILWYALRSLGEEGFRRIAKQSLETADYAISELRKRGINAWRNLNSITVVFPRPPSEMMERWVIAPHGDIAHIITLPHVTRETIDAFAEDFSNCYREDPRAR